MKKHILLALLLGGALGAANASEENGLYQLSDGDNQVAAPSSSTEVQVEETAYALRADEPSRTAAVEKTPSQIMDESQAVVPGANWPEGT